MIEQEHYFHMGLEFLEASIPIDILKEISKAKPKAFKTVCRNVGMSLRRDEEALNILKINRKKRAYELTHLGWLGGRWTKENLPREGEIA